MIDIPAGWAAVVTGIIAVGGSLIGLVTAWLATLGKRLRRLEHRDRVSWLYIRSLIDHAYRHGATPIPEPPPGWLDDDDE